MQAEEWREFNRYQPGITFEDDASIHEYVSRLPKQFLYVEVVTRSKQAVPLELVASSIRESFDDAAELAKQIRNTASPRPGAN